MELFWLRYKRKLTASSLQTRMITRFYKCYAFEKKLHHSNSTFLVSCSLFIYSTLVLVCNEDAQHMRLQRIKHFPFHAR
jgi:hypothetical protein